MDLVDSGGDTMMEEIVDGHAMQVRFWPWSIRRGAEVRVLRYLI